jgi:hypothetical protein
MEELLDFDNLPHQKNDNEIRSINDVLKNGYKLSYGKSFDVGYYIYSKRFFFFSTLAFCIGLVTIGLFVALPEAAILIFLLFAPLLFTFNYHVAKSAYLKSDLSLGELKKHFSNNTWKILGTTVSIILANIIVAGLYFTVMFVCYRDEIAEGWGISIKLAQISYYSTSLKILIFLFIPVTLILNSLTRYAFLLVIFTKTSPLKSVLYSSQIVVKSYLKYLFIVVLLSIGIILFSIFYFLFLSLFGIGLILFSLFIITIFIIPFSYCMYYAQFAQIFQIKQQK